MSIVVDSNDKAPVETTPKAAAATEGGEQAKGQGSDTSAAGGESTPGQNEAEESDPAAAEEGKEETEHEDSEEESEAEAPKDDKPKKKSGWQRTIDKKTRQAAEARREADEAKREAEFLRHRVRELSAGAADPKADPAKPTEAPGKPNPDQFDTHSEYVEALTDWKLEQRDKAREAKDQKQRLETEQERLNRTYVERRESFKTEHADWDDVMSEVDGIPVSPAVTQIILESENGPELAYELAKIPKEYARICKLSPLAAAREIGKIESRLAQKASSETKPETKKITKAPAPLAPVGNGGKGSAPKSIFDADISQAEYERLRAEQLKKRRQA